MCNECFLQMQTSDTIYFFIDIKNFCEFFFFKIKIYFAVSTVPSTTIGTLDTYEQRRL